MQRRTPRDHHVSKFWLTSVATAMAAREWAIACRLPDAEIEMVAGLLCDLGVLVLREVFPKQYVSVLDHPVEVLVASQCQLEEETVGANHAEVGAYLLRRWGLPEDVTEAIRCHHQPGAVDNANQEVTDRAYRLYFASLIGHLHVAPRDPSLSARLLQLSSERFRLDAPQLERFLRPLQDKVSEFAAVLNVDIGETPQYPTLLTQATEQLASETALENIRVHEQKDQADLRRQRSEEELDRLARQHDVILDAADEGIFGVDRQGRITFANPSAARTIGWEREELLGKLAHEVVQAVENGQTVPDWESSLFHAVLSDGQTRSLSDGQFTRRDGSAFPVRCTCAAMNERGAIVGAVVTYRDVSEVKRAEEAMHHSEEQLRQVQKMEAIGQLAGGVAHDFNNLLTIITGYGDLLLNGALRADDPARELVEQVLRASDRASTLTRQLLAFSRRQVLAPQLLVLNSAVLDMDKMLRRLIGEDIKLNSVLASDLDAVKADPGQIEQILLNLAVNARDAMPQGGHLTMETANVFLDENYARTRPEVCPGPYVMLAVTDTGCGMDAATQARIFEPFFTTKGAGKGTGLGLATVYGIVKQSEGSIFVYSEVGHGTSFKVYLPRAGEAPVVAPRLATPTARPGGRETLLVVEDDVAVRALTTTVLKMSAYEVMEASDGGEAIHLVEEHPDPIHLLVTDVIMPNMSGRVLAERLTSLRPEMKVLYVSGYTDDSVVRHGLLENEVEFLQKPFTPDALARKVREVLDQ
jgi:PAS domain S-box-containing protein